MIFIISDGACMLFEHEGRFYTGVVFAATKHSPTYQRWRNANFSSVPQTQPRTIQKVAERWEKDPTRVNFRGKSYVSIDHAIYEVEVCDKTTVVRRLQPRDITEKEVLKMLEEEFRKTTLLKIVTA